MIAICIAEDRPREEVAIKLLLLSLAEHCPEAQINLTYPPATEEFRDWLKQYPHCELLTERISGFSGWNVKAKAVFQLLEQGYKQVWWIDSDVIINGNFLAQLSTVPEDQLVVCEEALYGGHQDGGERTKSWGFNVGRSLPHSLNTAVLRATQKHTILLSKWMELLDSDAYRTAQSAHWAKRPKHMLGDQDVLTALLGSATFANVPLRVLQRGKDIIQYFGFPGYTTRERLGHLLGGKPLFVHCQGWKPWAYDPSSPEFSGAKAFLMELLLELSPYNTIAQRYTHRFDNPIPWLAQRSTTASFFQMIGFGVPALTGLPLAVMVDLARTLKRMLRWRRALFD